MKLNKAQKIATSLFFLLISVYQCVDNIEEERRSRSKKGKSQRTHKTKRVRSRRGKELDIMYDPKLEE